MPENITAGVHHDGCSKKVLKFWTWQSLIIDNFEQAKNAPNFCSSQKAKNAPKNLEKGKKR